MGSTISIGKKKIGDKYPPFIIAEIGQSHQGNLNKALKYINQLSKTGVDAIKFQTHIASEESTLNEPFRVKLKKFKSRFRYWKSTEFTPNEWRKISNYCNRKKIIFLSSPFSEKAVDLLSNLKMPAWKIASGEFFSKKLIQKIITTRKPLLISTGMSTYKDINELIKRLRFQKIKYLLFQCTSDYPSKKENIGLNVIGEFKKRFKCPAGLSDHSGNLMCLLSAIANGSNIIECHVQLGNKNNPDFTSSISIKDLKFLIDFKNYFFEIKNLDVDKNVLIKSVKKNKRLFSKSLAPKKNMFKGQIIKSSDLTEKKPGNGIKLSDKRKILGKKLTKDIKFNELFKPLHFN